MDKRAEQRELARIQAEAEAKMNRAISEAWDTWIASDEGQTCSNERGCFGEYLRNRLWRAFMAGAAMRCHTESVVQK